MDRDGGSYGSGDDEKRCSDFGATGDDDDEGNNSAEESGTDSVGNKGCGRVPASPLSASVEVFHPLILRRAHSRPSSSFCGGIRRAHRQISQPATISLSQL